MSFFNFGAFGSFASIGAVQEHSVPFSGVKPQPISAPAPPPIATSATTIPMGVSHPAAPLPQPGLSAPYPKGSLLEAMHNEKQSPPKMAIAPSAGGFELSSLRGHGTPDIAHVDNELLARFDKTQKDLGVKIPIVAGFATSGHVGHSEHYNGDAIDLDVSGLSRDQQVQLIKTARSNGIQGIGVYASGSEKARSFHFDMGKKWGKRAWGPDYHSDSIPDWARSALND